MILEILISTMNRDNLSFMEDIFVHNNFNNLQILIVNQTSKDKVIKSDNDNIRVINSFEFGLSKSRNLAINNAVGDICLIADDDVQYVKGFDEIIKNAFKKNPYASIIKFKIDTFCGRKYKAYPKNSKKLKTKKEILSASSIEMAFKRKDIYDKNILFNICFGLGSYFPSGEEYLFLRESLKKGLTINFENEYIVKHAFERSTSNMGSDNFVKSKAAIYYLEYRKFSYLFLLKYILFVLRRRDIKFRDFKTKFKVGVKAIKEYKALQIKI